MEIDTLEDFDINSTYLDSETSLWNGHDIEWIESNETNFQENIDPLLEIGSSNLLSKEITQSSEKPKKDIWTGANDLVNLYLGLKIRPSETAVSLGCVITSPISLSQLLSFDYLNQQTLQIPFTLPPELANLPPFFQIPEGLSLDIFNIYPTAPPPSLFQLDPRLLDYGQKYLAAENTKPIEPTLEIALAKIMAEAQSNSIKHVLADITAADQARTAAISLAKEKAQIAAAEYSKAIEAARKAQSLATPPHVPQRGFATEPYEYTYSKWLAEKQMADAQAAEQARIAIQAIEEAKNAGAVLTEQTQALATAQANALSLIEAPPQQISFYPQLGLEILCGREYVSNLYQQFGLPDPYLEIPTQSLPKQETPYLSQLLESVGIRDPYNPNSPFTDPSYPKFTLKIEEPKNTHRLTDEEAFALLSVESHFKDKNPKPPAVSNYASTLSSTKPPGPFHPVPLLGYNDQSTIHFHCGIYNNLTTIIEGGLCLSTTLDKGFAIQPHLIHSNNVAKGVLMVLLQGANSNIQELQSAGIELTAPILTQLPEFVLEHSQIKQSIEYEIQNLTTIAQSILATGNPNLKQVHVTFSNGGYVFKEALKQLLPEYRDTIIVITAGTTSIIENDLAHMVYNMIGSKDWPSQVCNGGMKGIEEAKNNGADVRIIPQTETQTGIGGHYFIQPDYQSEISKFIKKEISNEYEIY